MSEASDRIEAKMDRLITLLERAEERDSEASLFTYSVEKLQPLDPNVWPEWYRDLYSLPNFKKDLAECQQWLSEKLIIGAQADETTAYIRGVWPGPRKTWKQPWAVFRNLVVKPRPQGASHGATGQHLPTNPQEQATEDRIRSERLSQRRGNVPDLPGNGMGQPSGPA